MKLGLISQIKNEIDIIKPFLRHIDAIFDVVYLLDHRSIDGTEDFLKQAVSQRPNWKYYLLDFHGNFQKLVSNYFMHKIFESGIDFLFYLDADEFIQSPDRFTLDEKLKNFNNKHNLAKLRWVNCVPESFKLPQLKFGTRLYQSSQKSSFCKVIIPRSTFKKNKSLTISTGNHNVYINDEIEIQAEQIGTLIHIPIRSESQAIKKALTTAITLSSIANKPQGQNFQYDEFIRNIALGDIDEKKLQLFAALYDSPNASCVMECNETFWNQKQPISLSQIQVAYSNSLRFTRENRSTPLYTILAETLLQQEHLPHMRPQMYIDGEVVRLNDADEAIDDHVTNNTCYQTLNDQMSELKNALIDANRKINDYEVINQVLANEVKTHEQEILFFAQSKSWHFTRPLRKLMRLIRKSFFSNDT